MRDAKQAIEWIIQDFTTLAEQPVGQSASRQEMEALLREPPPEEGTSFADVLSKLESDVKPYAYRTNHPRFLAFVPGTPSFYSVLGELLCAGLNFFSGVWIEAAGPSQIEILILDWFKQFLGYPQEAKGSLTSGGSEANLTALVVARETLSDDERQLAVLYVTEQRHWSIDRAAKVMGLRTEQIHPVPADDHYRMDLDQLQARIDADRRAGRKPWAVVANAGATNTGAVDRLNDLSDICEREQLWLHVDAAYGWSAVLADAGREQLVGIERADSLTLDPHKWFAQTFETGCLLVKDGERLAQTFSLRPEYLQDVIPTEEEINFADYGIALTRRFRALRIWLSIKALGMQWFRQLIQRGLDLAKLAESLLRESGDFEILSPAELSIVCFRYRPCDKSLSEEEIETLNQQIVNAIRETKLFFMSSTKLRGRLALRFCFVNWRTTTEDVERIIEWLQSQSKPNVQGQNFD